MDTKARMLEVLSRGYLVSLGTTDEGGVWVSDVIYTYDDDLNIYWMSLPKTRHSQAIEKSSKAAGSITATSYGEKPELGLQFGGEAEKLDSLSFDLVKKYFAKQGDEEPEEGEDVLGKHSWYVLRPTRIDLIDTENLGWSKQSLDL